MTSIVFERTRGLVDTPTSYCPGCPHGIAHRLVAEVLVESGLLPKTIGIASVGCSVTSYKYFNCDMLQAPHGRAPAVATGVKRVLPDRTVFTYQGDGDLAAIGTAETVHAAARGENITVIFINNAIYGMTGGQMAPTTLPGQKSSTSQSGRQTDRQGYPVKVAEMLATLPGAAYIERVALGDPANVRKAKKAIHKAFETQKKGLGFSLVELLSTCSTNWRMTPVESLIWMKDKMVEYFPPGVYRFPGEAENSKGDKRHVL